MSDTRRIYNKLTMKKTKRIDLTKPMTPLFKDMNEEEMAAYVSDSLRNSVREHGFLYHPYASGLCMGHCPHCRDPTKDQRHQRKIRKREFNKIVDDEISCAVMSEASLAVDWDKPEEDEAWRDL